MKLSQNHRGRHPQAVTFEGWIYFILFIGCVFLANYLVRHVGVARQSEGGPWLVPVWPGLMAPSGVLAIGLGFTLRDLVQRRLGIPYALAGIVCGAGLSAVLSPSLALASGIAFLVSEMLDLLVYTPLQQRHLTTAVLASNLVGLAVDSMVFLSLAFGSLAYLPGQMLGKFWMTLAFLPVIELLRKWDRKRGLPVDA